MRHGRRGLLLLVMAMVAMVVTAVPADAATASVNPTSGPSGTSVTASGTGYTQGFPPCDLFFDGVDVGNCTVNGNGVASGSFTVPSKSPGSYSVVICNYCGNGEFEERGTTSFTVTAPPTTTTTTAKPTTTTTQTTTTVPATTTTRPATTTTRPASTTTRPAATTTTAVAPPTTPGATTTSTSAAPTTVPTTTTTVVRPASLPPIVHSAALPDLGPGSAFAGRLGAWTPLVVPEGTFRLPELWLTRCGAPTGAEIEDFDIHRAGTRPALGSSRSRVTATRFEGVRASSHGSATAPNVGLFRPLPGPEIGQTSGQDVRFQFDRPVTYFGLMVGLPTASASPIVVQLGGETLGTFLDVDRIDLGPSPSPATHCLVVVAPEGRPFNAVSLRVYADGVAADQAIDLEVDRMYWHHSARYPLDAEPEVAEVDIVFPPDGSNLRTQPSTGVLGRVTVPTGVPLTRLDVASPSWDGSRLVVRRAEVGRFRRLSGGQSSAWFWVDEVAVPPGEFDIAATLHGPSLRGADRVTVTGRGLAAPPRDVYRDQVAGEVDIVPWGMEVTQAVRGPVQVQAPGTVIEDDFPLVADKRTVVRGYAVQEHDVDLRPTTLQVEAVLHGTRDGVTLPFSPLTAESSPTNVFKLDPGPADERQSRPSMGNTFNFTLPYQWSTAGEIELRLEVNPPGSPYGIAERPGTGSNVIGQRVRFQSTGRVGVGVIHVDFYWRCEEEWLDDESHPCEGRSEGDVVSTTTSEDAARNAARTWWKMWPAAGDSPSYMTHGRVAVPHKTDEPRADLPSPEASGNLLGVSPSDWRRAYHDKYCDGTWFPFTVRPPSYRMHLAMTQPDFAPLRGGGCASTGGRSAHRSRLVSGTLAQETAHTMGLKHAGDRHGERRGGGAVIRWEPDHGEIGDPSEESWAFDTATMTPVRPPRDSHVHDYLSYGWPWWTSVDGWKLVFESLRDNRHVGEPRGPVLGRDDSAGASSDGDAEDALGDPVPIAAQAAEEAVVIRGAVVDGAIQAAPPQLVAAGTAGGVEGDDVTIRLLDAAGDDVAVATAGFAEGATHSPISVDEFVVELPLAEGAVALRIEADGVDPLVVEVEGEAPAIEITEVPSGGGTLRWQAAGLDGPFVVEASDDGGDEWWTVATTEPGDLAIDLEPSFLQGQGWRLRVQGTDGVRVAAASVDGVDLGTTEPSVAITAPRDGQHVTLGMIEVEASRTSIGGGVRYRWLVDGEEVNAGPRASIPITEAGEHTITVVAANAEGEATAEITVVGGLDLDGDGFTDDWEDEVGLDPERFDEPGDDPDDDGLPTGDEYARGTDPDERDTDGDRYSDGLEVTGGGDPLDPDSWPAPAHGAGDDSGLLIAEPDVISDEGGGGLGLLGVLAALIAVGLAGGWFWRRRAAGPVDEGAA